MVGGSLECHCFSSVCYYSVTPTEWPSVARARVSSQVTVTQESKFMVRVR